MKKKILFTIQWYPSVMSANALCDQKIIKELIKHDVDITCLTYKGENQSKEEFIDNIRVIRFRRSKWWDMYMHAQQHDSKTSRIILKLDRVFLRLKQLFTIPIYPFVNLKSCIKYVIKSIKLHRTEKFDIVVSEHHGIDSMMAGFALKLIDPKIKFVNILWDPISAKEPARYLPASYAKRRTRLLEKMIIKKADALIGMKPSEQTVRNIIKVDTAKHFFFDIPGIIKPLHRELTRTDILKEGYVNVVFSGILSLPDRDPGYIIKALNQTTVAEKINLIFLCTGAGKNKLYQLKKEFRGNISIMSYIPYNDMLSVYENVDILLNFGGRNPNMVPSKIFEYMSYGKPIISMYAIDNEASKSYLEKYPLALCIDERLELAKSVDMLELFFREKVGLSVKFEDVEQLFPLNNPKIYSNLIMSL